jgi:DNA-binding response OmpR family regulator
MSVSQPRVLIVDASRDCREVLRMLLEQRGATTMEAEGPAQAVRLADEFRPNLIVLDAESDPSPAGDATRDLSHAATRSHTPIVILGKLRQPQSVAASQIVAKPYHYGPLIRKIDRLLAVA